MAEKMPEGKYMSSVRVGPKGQIVIPKEARDLFGIRPGDTLLLLADVDRGIAINRMEYFLGMAEAAFRDAPGASAEEKGRQDLAQAIRREKEKDDGRN